MRRVSPLEVNMFILSEIKYQNSIIKRADSEWWEGVKKLFSKEGFTNELQQIKDWANNLVKQQGGIVGTLEYIISEGIVDKLAYRCFGWTGLIGNQLISMLGFDIGKILRDMIDSFLGYFKSNPDKPMAESQAAAIAYNAVDSHDSNHSDDGRFGKIKAQRIYLQAELVCLGLQSREKFRKNAAIPGLKSILKSIFSWLGGALLWGIGGLVGGGVVSSTLGTLGIALPTASSGNGSNTAQSAPPQEQEVPSAIQTIFERNKNYNPTLFSGSAHYISMQPTENNIINQLIGFTKKVYVCDSDVDSYIKNDPKFQEVVDHFVTINTGNILNIIIIPSKYRTVKNIVDEYIDSVAQKYEQDHKTK
jgi:hypothetical protein